jgi:hypothetical protein
MIGVNVEQQAVISTPIARKFRRADLASSGPECHAQRLIPMRRAAGYNLYGAIPSLSRVRSFEIIQNQNRRRGGQERLQPANQEEKAGYSQEHASGLPDSQGIA